MPPPTTAELPPRRCRRLFSIATVVINSGAPAGAAVGQRQIGDVEVGPGVDHQDAAVVVSIDGQQVGAGAVDGHVAVM